MNSRETHLLDYDHKPKGYYESTRLEMLKYISKETTKSLEFGCGDGGFSFYLNAFFTDKVKCQNTII